VQASRAGKGALKPLACPGSGISAILQHDAVLFDIYRKLLPLLQPPPDPPKRRIGFHTGGE